MNAGGVDEACKSNEAFRACSKSLVAEGLVIHKKPTPYMGITAGNGC